MITLAGGVPRRRTADRDLLPAGLTRPYPIRKKVSIRLSGRGGDGAALGFGDVWEGSLSVEEPVDPLAGDRLGGRYATASNGAVEVGEPPVLGQPLPVAAVDLLHDDGDLEQAVDVVEDEVAEVAAGGAGVELRRLPRARGCPAGSWG